MKLTILIPVYNEQRTIQKVVNKVRAVSLGNWQKEIIIIDDCSTDGTAKKIKHLTKFKDIRTVYHPINLGKGAAIKTGLRFATGDYLIIQDADFEYDPGDIPRLLSVVEKQKNVVVYGSRFKGQHEDTIFGHKFGNQMLTLITNVLFNLNLTDMETCYKLIPRPVYTTLSIQSERFNFEPEVTAKIAKKKIPIVEVPVTYKKRDFSEGKKIKWWRDGVTAVITLLWYRIL